MCNKLLTIVFAMLALLLSAPAFAAGASRQLVEEGMPAGKKQNPPAVTTTFNYTATGKIERFNEFQYFTGADSVVSHVYNESTGEGTVVYAGSVTALGSDALQWTSSLKSIVIPEGVTTIGFRGFYACSNLASITLPKSLKHVRNLAFDGCSGLAQGKFIIDDIAWWCGITFESVYANPLFYANHIYADEETEITELVIPDGVASIGQNVFCHCTSINGVRFPAGLTEIGANAFSQCTSLEAVNIPSTVTVIGESAFNRCTKLESVTIPEGVATIKNGAFAHSGLRSLTLPSTIREISQGFYNCDSLAELNLTYGITTLGGSFYSCPSLTTVRIPGSVKIITSSDFNNCSGLQTVILEDGVEVVNMGSCEKLSSINFPSTVTEIGGFNGCSRLTGITIPRSVTRLSGFHDCFALERITIEDLEAWCRINFATSYESYTPQYYAHHLFLGDEEITNLVIPKGITQLTRYAFNHLTGIASVTIPASVTSIDGSTFLGCSGIDNVYCAAEPFKSWNGNGFKDERATLFHVADLEKWRAKFPEANVTFTGDLSKIGYTATQKAAAFDNSVNFIGTTGVLSHDYDEETGAGAVLYLGEMKGIYEGALADCSSITSVVLPEGVTTINSRAFYNCDSMATITLPSTIITIDDCAFEGAQNITDVYCSSDTAGVTWNGNANTQQFMANKGTLCHVTDARAWQTKFPDANVTFVGDMTLFAYTAPLRCEKFDEIEKFVGASRMVSHVYNPETRNGNVIFDAEVTAIDDQCFNNSNLISATIPQSVTSLGSWVFAYCDSLTEVCLPMTLSEMGTDAFYRCTSLTSVNIPTSLTKLRSFTFSGCSSLAEILIPDNITAIEDYAFNNCSALTTIKIPVSVAKIGSNCFNGCTGLTKVVTPDVEAWCKVQFNNERANPLFYAKHLYKSVPQSTAKRAPSEGAAEVTELDIPEGITAINAYSFINDEGLVSVSAPSSVTLINNDAFNGCTNLARMELGGGLEQIKWRAFKDCPLTELTLPATLNKIEQNAFDGLNALANIYCDANPDNVSWTGFDNMDYFMSDKATRFHVLNNYLNRWVERYGAANVTFVGDHPSGITNIASGADAGDERCFDLMGRPVGQNYKGVVITKGKKIIKK